MIGRRNIPMKGINCVRKENSSDEGSLKHLKKGNRNKEKKNVTVRL